MGKSKIESPYAKRAQNRAAAQPQQQVHQTPA